jgi:hypothetical protein
MGSHSHNFGTHRRTQLCEARTPHPLSRLKFLISDVCSLCVKSALYSGELYERIKELTGVPLAGQKIIGKITARMENQPKLCLVSVCFWQLFNVCFCYVESVLEVLSSEMDEAKSGLIRKLIIKERGADILSKIPPPPPVL